MTKHIHHQDCFVEGTQVCGVTPAEQASKQVPSRLNIMSLIREQCHRQYIAGATNDQPDGKYLAEIEAAICSLAGQPAAPVAATEQATARDIWTLLCEHGEYSRSGNYTVIYEHHIKSIHDRIKHLFAPLATPADAGAGLTDERIDELWGESSWKLGDGKPTMRFVFARAIEREVRARLSTSAAPVTAEPVAQTLYEVLKQVEEELRGRSFSQHRVREGNSDVWRYIGKGEQVAAAVREAVQRYAAPVSPQPAAQVPSRERDAMREAWQVLLDAGVCPGLAPMSLADGIRVAIKGQPAAAHAAHDQKGGGK